ncbi:helix-turn-helix domain-containing protein [Seleniivibrio woodruffii]|uniref:XRE family transcriptional regulator n=1 Tax=Seleniivibrio woodruffii TaxID=1078050 RepID=A0A4R1KCR4_9BACT|nr:helix-turn-helix domain-containing protein [Seleniivibrio woodruffii]TCK60969.1 XRE family transcriptional regulator [Seleniivibrio woodruffii]TVZ36599.1 XRE family transcriptional regulator [Seleniivibrio woodruffii]
MEDIEIKIGERVRKIRNERGLTLQDVANFTGFSKALISQIENNIVMPPINTLGKIAKVLNVKMTYFFEEEVNQNDFFIVRSEEKKFIYREGVKHGYMYEELAKIKSFDYMDWLLVTVKPEKMDEKLFSHEGFEYMYVVQGGIKMKLGSEDIDLNEGDSIAFNSKIPHAAVTLDNRTALILNAHLKIEKLTEAIKNG